MVARTTVTLGPFVGGLNNAAGTPDTIGDNEVFECIDFDYNVDFTLVTRPPVAVEAVGTDEDNPDPFGFCKIVGFYVSPNTNTVYTIANFGNDIYYRTGGTTFGDGGPWTLITSGFGVVTAAVQYVDYIYFIKSSTSGGGRWKPATPFLAIPTIPAGTSAALFKERLWISVGSTSELKWSNIADPTAFPPANIAQVDAGNGQALNCIYAGPSALYLFKTSSTYILAYDADPARGSIQNISKTIGIYDNNCYTEYEGTIFILYGSQVYRLDAYTYTKINEKVDIAKGATLDFRPEKFGVSTIGDRIFISYYNKTFCYYPITNTWTEWKLPAVAKWYKIPLGVINYGYDIYLAAANATAPVAGRVHVLYDRNWQTGDPVDAVVADPELVTKMYTLDGPERFKRLHWWGVDAIVDDESGSADIQLNAAPYQINGDITWGSIAQFTVGQTEIHTWQEVFSDANFIFGTRLTVDRPERKYLKAFASLRFPRIQFRVRFPGYRHTRKSSINHLILNLSQKENPVAKSEGQVSI